MNKHNVFPSDINSFQTFWDLGYRGLLPVIPHDGGTSHAGKQPGVRSSTGVWVEKGYQEFKASLDTIGIWAEMRASVGLSCHDTGLCGIDIDTLSPKWAPRIADIAQETLGKSFRRIGRAPKVLLPYRCPVEMNFARLPFRDDHEQGRPGLVECLAGKGKWFVAHGIHPQTLEPYAWPDGIPRFDELPTITVKQRDAFFVRLRSELPEAFRVIQGGLGTAVPPELLRGDLDMVREAMSVIPNDPEQVDYQAWCEMAAAIRGAVGIEDGLEIFEEWSDKAGFSVSTPRYREPRKLFLDLDPGNLRLGAKYIYDHAEMAGWPGWIPGFVDKWFLDSPPPEDVPFESIFGKSEADAEGGKFAFVHIDDVVERALDYVPRPLIKGLLEEQTMSVVYGDSNVGKTFVALDMAYHVATGRAYAGMEVTQGGVAYVTTEGGRGVDDRLAGLKAYYKDGTGVVPFYLLSTSIDLHAVDGDTRPLIEDIKRLGVPVSMIVVDVLAQTMGQGEENATRDMGAMVRNGNRIIRATGAHLMWIHHTGKDLARGARGSSALRAGTDTELEVADGVITATKQRNLALNWSIEFKLVSFTAGVRRYAMQMIDTCVVELLPKGSKDADMNLTAALKDVLDVLGEMGAVSEEHSEAASDVVAWLEGRGEKVTLANARMRLNRLVKMDAVCRTKRGNHARYYLANGIKTPLFARRHTEGEMFASANTANKSEQIRPGGVFD